MLWSVDLPFRDRSIECSRTLSCCLCLGPFSTSIVTRDTKWLHFASFEVFDYRCGHDWRFTVLCLLDKSICLCVRPETLIRTRASVLLHASSHCVVLLVPECWGTDGPRPPSRQSMANDYIHMITLKSNSPTHPTVLITTGIRPNTSFCGPCTYPISDTRKHGSCTLLYQLGG
jgi:hypothetical protein